MCIKIISVQLWICSKLHHFLLILLLLERMIMFASEIFLIPLLNLNVLIYLGHWRCLWSEGLSVSLRHRFLVILEYLNTPGLGYLYDLQMMCLISKQWLQLVGKHFIINNYHDINLEMADDLSQTLCSPVILRCESINNTATGKCLRVSWCYEPFKFFFFNIEIVFRLFAW
jgi:hypothetical protein